jgi:hypothetical protein
VTLNTGLDEARCRRTIVRPPDEKVPAAVREPSAVAGQPLALIERLRLNGLPIAVQAIARPRRESRDRPPIAIEIDPAHAGTSWLSL